MNSMDDIETWLRAINPEVFTVLHNMALAEYLGVFTAEAAAVDVNHLFDLFTTEQEDGTRNIDDVDAIRPVIGALAYAAMAAIVSLARTNPAGSEIITTFIETLRSSRPNAPVTTIDELRARGGRPAPQD